MTSMTFGVHGRPAPQGSKTHVGRGIMIEASKYVAPWRAAVMAAAIEAAQLEEWERADGPVAVTTLFFLPRPKAHYGTGKNEGVLKPSAPTFPAVRPDLDKLERSTWDALTLAKVIGDDSRIVGGSRWKHYADARPPGAVITIERLD